MSYPLACADFAFPLLAHEHSLDVIARLGVQGVDIGLFEGRSHLRPSVEFQNATARGQALGVQVRNRGLQVADVFLQMDPDFTAWAVNHPESSRRAQARDWFERTLEYATACGCRHVTTLPGVVFEGESTATSWGRCRDELAWRVERSGAAGITFGVEAHVGSIAPTPADAAELVTGVPGLTLTLDYTHFTRAGLPDSQIEPLVAHASHFHARGAREGRLQTSFKDNVIDYARIVRAMRRAEYSGWIGIEYVWTEWERCNEVDNLSETVLFRDFFRERFAAETWS